MILRTGITYLIKNLTEALNGAPVEYVRSEEGPEDKDGYTEVTLTFRFLENWKPYNKGEHIALEKYHVEELHPHVAESIEVMKFELGDPQ